MLTLAFQYQEHKSNSQTPGSNNTITTNATLTKNQTSTTPISSNQTHVIPRIGQFVTSDYAYKQIPDNMFQFNRTALQRDFRPELLYLKYNGSITLPNSSNVSANYPSFLQYPANSSSGSVNYSAIPTVIVFNYDDHHGRMFVNSTEDRFVWAFITGREGRSWTSTYVDSQNGVLVGYSNSCAYGTTLVESNVCPA